MKNTIKMSLVAALAVAGLSTTASAGSLEEAIKGVSISGKMEVEYDYSDSKASTATRSSTSNNWDLDWDVTAKIPVNDNVTAVFGLEGDQYNDNAEAQIDGKGNIQVTKTYFQYANGPVTALVGKQGMAGAPWFDDERGNGIVALYNAGVATFAAAHFNGSNADATNNNNAQPVTSLTTSSKLGLEETDITAVAAIASMGPVNAQLWYASLSGITKTISTTTAQDQQLDADSWALIADINLDVANITVKYGQADYEYQRAGANYTYLNDDAEMLQIIASTKVDAATLYAGYGATDSKQGGAGLDLTSDTDSAMDFGSEQLSIDDLDDADAFIIGGSMPFGALTVGASYVWGDYAAYTSTDTTKTTAQTADFDEFLVEADYKMSKNFTIGAHYSVAEIETAATSSTKITTDLDAASVSLEYKF